MSKKQIITLSIIIGIIALLLILFGAVFCLRNVTVTTLYADSYPLTIIQDGQEVEITSDDIIQAAGLKKGSSIFTLDKDTAIENIEEAYPSLKVVQIKTVSVVRVEIIVRARVGVYYTEINVNDTSSGDQSVGYYILDEDLVILQTLVGDNGNDVPNNYTYLNIEGLNLEANITLYSQISTSDIQEITADAFNYICSAVKILETDEEIIVSDSENAEYVERETFSSIIESIEIVQASVAGYDSYVSGIYWLVITTRNGEKIEILRPDEDLLTKINYCFAAIPLLEDGNNTIICRYDENDELYYYQTYTEIDDTD